ncbi:Arc family DNA-binding protein [Agrobacterium vitis]|uniref:Arc family DNA-binding protein n=1 Tax=Agrobacterium vitis TaxID=373 RepID=UPI001571FAE5|nr:Arc family DNA-binding protein [Agrobacterium vitis]NSY10803.1 Arc family DNA-binding protein [Agrobacterium vitis]
MSVIETGRKSDQYVVRLSEGLREVIKAAAKKNKRSMNSEIIACLEAAYALPASSEPKPDSKPRMLVLMRDQHHAILADVQPVPGMPLVRLLRARRVMSLIGRFDLEYIATMAAGEPRMAIIDTAEFTVCLPARDILLMTDLPDGFEPKDF